MTKLANRLNKLEQLTDEGRFIVVAVREGECELSTWERYVACPTVNGPAAMNARAAGRVHFLAASDANL